MRADTLVQGSAELHVFLSLPFTLHNGCTMLGTQEMYYICLFYSIAEFTVTVITVPHFNVHLRMLFDSISLFLTWKKAQFFLNFELHSRCTVCTRTIRIMCF